MNMLKKALCHFNLLGGCHMFAIVILRHMDAPEVVGDLQQRLFNDEQEAKVVLRSAGWTETTQGKRYIWVKRGNDIAVILPVHTSKTSPGL